MPIDLPVRPRTAHRGRPDALIAAAALGVCAVIVAAVSWSRPATMASTISYTQSGSLTYSAPASPRSVYGSSGVRTGEPVYGASVNALAIGYDYRLQSAAAVDAAGTEQLVATVTDGGGLARDIPLQPAVVPFSGPRFTATATLHLADVQAIVAAFDQAAGSAAAQSYAVAISPSVVVHGHVGGRPIATSFAQPIGFTYSSGDLLPAASGGGQPSFTSTTHGSVSVPGATPAQLLFGVSVTTARIGSLVVLLAALLFGGLAGWPLLRDATSDDERARISARHGSSVIEAAAITAAASVVVVQLDSFDGLLQVARQLECPVLHWTDGGDVYAVIDSGTLYRYRAHVIAHPHAREAVING